MYSLLFVDDEERALEAIQASIPWKDLNTEVVGWCTDSMSALQVLMNEHVDILITDIKMPVMNGLELVRQAKSMDPAIECIILSGYGEFEFAQSAIDSGVRGYLLKPFRKSELEDKIRQCIQAIEQASGSAQYWQKQHRKNVEMLCESLMNLSMQNTPQDEEDVRNVLEKTGDPGVQREAALLLMAQNDIDPHESRTIARNLSQNPDSETLLKSIVSILRLSASHPGISDPIIAKMVAFIHRNYQLPGLTVQYIAENEIHLTSRYLGKRFTRVMHMKYSDYLLKVRMEKAMELIRETSCSGEEIAAKVGLGNNVLYFYRLFHQYTRMTYSAYRHSVHPASEETHSNGSE